ncbi:MAG TPA: hypothetical protein VI248_14090 [Kineosporiaceae bacterium]
MVRCDQAIGRRFEDDASSGRGWRELARHVAAAAPDAAGRCRRPTLRDGGLLDSCGSSHVFIPWGDTPGMAGLASGRIFLLARMGLDLRDG